MTGVPSERMKLMAKIKCLWRRVLKMMLISQQLNFLKWKRQSKLSLWDLQQRSSSFVNLSNTCYLNSVVQYFLAIPSVRTGLVNCSKINDNNNNAGQSPVLVAIFMFNLRDFYYDISRTSNPVQSSRFVIGIKLAVAIFLYSNDIHTIWYR